jgi:GNAT superfamily N-acetyltransferase
VTDAHRAVRAATVEDLDAIDGVLRATNPPAPGESGLPAGVQHPYLRHLIDHGAAAVAEVGGAIVGFGATIFTGRVTHLADLFVLPAHQGQGLGGRLLDAVFRDRRPRTTFSSDDPRAIPLYVRAGMSPLWPNVYLAGDPARLHPPEGLTVEPTTLEEIARLDGEWGGVDRSVDVGYWQTLPGARPFVVRRSRRPVAVAVGRSRLNGRGRWVDRARVAPDESAVPPLLVAMAAAGEGSDLVGACVLGPSPLLPLLLEAGFRIRDRDTFMASEPGLVDPERELVNTGIL